jgi:hypothetical protein
MRRLLPVWVLALVALGASTALGQTIISYNGNSWETGGFPSSTPGDEFEAVGDITDVFPPLTWDTSLYQYTWYAWDLISLGESVSGSDVTVFYSGGEFQIYVDDFFPVGTNRDYGTNPPNATAPSTFTDATNGDPNYLHGFFSSFKVEYNTSSNTGNWEGTLDFNSGTFVNNLGQQDGYTFAATLGPPFPPAGYTLEGGGDIFLQANATEETSWGKVKGLYQD